jgi:hypothetical protein
MWKRVAESEEVTDDNMAHANCMLHTYGYKHTLTELQQCLYERDSRLSYN